MANNLIQLEKLESLLERAKLNSVTEFEEILLKTYDKIRESIPTEPQNRARLNAFLNEVTLLMKEDYPHLLDLIKQDQKEWAEVSYNSQAQALADVTAKGAVVATTFASLNETATKKVLNDSLIIQGLTLKEQINKLEAGTSSTVRGILAEGIMQGAPTNQIAQDVKEVLTHTARNKVEALSRQAIQTSLNEANSEAYRQFSTVVNYAVYHAVLDTRTTPYCNTMNGHTWKRKKNETYNSFRNRVLTPIHGRSPQTPTHWGCRSKLSFTTKEYYQEWQTEQQKAITRDTTHERKNVTHHRDGTTSRKFRIKDIDRVTQKNKNFDFINWFDNFADEDFKEFYLGKRKYNLYKDSQLSYKDLVNVDRKSVV